MQKTKEIVIEDEGRDKGKRFVIEEMPSYQGEKWALRVIFAAANAGVEIPDDIAESGMSGLATMGKEIFQKIPFESADPLLDELMGCVKFSTGNGFARELVETDTVEVRTRLKLRMESLMFHLNVFMGGAD